MRAAMCAVALAAILLAVGCADRNAIVHEIKNYDSGQTVRNEQRQEPPQTAPQEAAHDPAGPMQLTRKPAPPTEQPERPGASTENRYAFLDWFGASADKARVRNSAAVLRQARTVTAAMPENAKQPPDAPPRAPVSVGDDSRLKVTFNDDLPSPHGQNLVLRGADITGSVTQKRPETAPAVRTERDAAVAAELKKAERRLELSRSKTARTEQRTALSDPQAETTYDATPALPDRDNPVRLELSSKQRIFGKKDLAVLREIAQLHLQSGRKLHIRAVARGNPGGRDDSMRRVKRLNRHIDRAMEALGAYGVEPHLISSSMAEQRTAGTGSDGLELADRDRLELSFD